LAEVSAAELDLRKVSSMAERSVELRGVLRAACWAVLSEKIPVYESAAEMDFLMAEMLVGELVG